MGRCYAYLIAHETDDLCATLLDFGLEAAQGQADGLAFLGDAHLGQIGASVKVVSNVRFARRHQPPSDGGD
jgi:hypothetical protein